MKKIFKIVAAAVLALSMSLTAFAAPSSSVNGTVKIVSATDADGNAMDDLNYIATRETQAADKSKVDTAVADINTALKAAGITPSKTMKVVAAFDIYKVGNPKLPATVTFAVTGMTSGKEAYIIHGIDSGWENVTTAKGDGTITGKFSDVSPVIIVMEDGTAASGTNTTNGQAGPATGVPFAWPAAIAALALIGMCVLAFTGKKRAR